MKLLPLVILLASGLSAGPVYIGSTTDAVGDSFGPDIVFAKILLDDTNVSFRMDFVPGTFNPLTTKSSFEIDADQNPLTGIAWNGMGIDIHASQGYLGDTSNAYLWVVGGTTRTTGVTFGPNRVEYQFARGLFPDDGLLNYLAIVQTALSANSSTTIQDWAPAIAQPGNTSAIPEPSASALIGFGLLGIAFLRLRRL